MKRITVFDYDDVWYGSAPWHENIHGVKEMTVENARCVGGIEGILAFFEYDEKFCIAAGDDGHWWLIYTCHKSWEKKISEKICVDRENKI